MAGELIGFMAESAIILLNRHSIEPFSKFLSLLVDQHSSQTSSEEFLPAPMATWKLTTGLRAEDMCLLSHNWGIYINPSPKAQGLSLKKRQEGGDKIASS